MSGGRQTHVMGTCQPLPHKADPAPRPNKVSRASYEVLFASSCYLSSSPAMPFYSQSVPPPFPSYDLMRQSSGLDSSFSDGNSLMGLSHASSEQKGKDQNHCFRASLQLGSGMLVLSLLNPRACFSFLRFPICFHCPSAELVHARFSTLH